jgi:DNA polymerase II small subunit/DNA polymerase delta subunit B
MAKHKYIETPEKLFELFEEYKKNLKPREIQKATATGVKSEFHKPPLTLEGFEVFGFSKGVTLDHYFRNTNGAYEEYCAICLRIKKEIRQDQIEGGMVGQFNPSITQRLNGLTEKTDVTTNGKDISKIEIQIVTNENQID